jgi:hypothetical protein
MQDKTMGPSLDWDCLLSAGREVGGVSAVKAIYEAVAMTSEKIRDRRRDALIGLAIGDALGAAIEFHSPGTFAPVTGYRTGGPHGLAAGEWTDDTSMALVLADSIASVGRDLNDQADRYVQCGYYQGNLRSNGRCVLGRIQYTQVIEERFGTRRHSG